MDNSDCVTGKKDATGSVYDDALFVLPIERET